MSSAVDNSSFQTSSGSDVQEWSSGSEEGSSRSGFSSTSSSRGSSTRSGLSSADSSKGSSTIEEKKEETKKEEPKKEEDEDISNSNKKNIFSMWGQKASKQSMPAWKKKALEAKKKAQESSSTSPAPALASASTEAKKPGGWDSYAADDASDKGSKDDDDDDAGAVSESKKPTANDTDKPAETTTTPTPPSGTSARKWGTPSTTPPSSMKRGPSSRVNNVPSFLPPSDKKPSTPPWMKKRKSILSAKKEEKKEEKPSTDDTKKEESKDASSAAELPKPPPPPPADVRSPPPPPPGSPSTESEVTVRTDDLDEEIVLDSDDNDSEYEVALKDSDDEGDDDEHNEEVTVDDDEDSAMETDDEEVEEVVTDDEEDVLVETDDEEEVITSDDIDSQDADAGDGDDVLDVKKEISKIQASTPKDSSVPRKTAVDDSKPAWLLTGSVPKAQKMSEDSRQATERLAMNSKPEEVQEAAPNIQRRNVPFQSQKSPTPETVTLRSTPQNQNDTKPTSSFPSLKPVNRTNYSSQNAQTLSKSPTVAGTSQAVGGAADTNITQEQQQQQQSSIENWKPISTDDLPFRHSVAREVATNPEAFIEKQKEEIPESTKKHDNSSGGGSSGVVKFAPEIDDANSGIDSWMVPRRHDDDSSWVNPIREVDTSRKQRVVDGIELKRNKELGDLLDMTGLKQFSGSSSGDDKTVSTIGQRSVVGEASANADTTPLNHAAITEQTWNLPSRATQHRGYVDLAKEPTDEGKDYRFSYIAAPQTHSTASYSDTIREKFFPNQDNPIWEPSKARSGRVGLDSHLSSSSPRGVSTPIGDEEESWMPPDEADLVANPVKVAAKVGARAPTHGESATQSTLSVGSTELDWAPESITRTKRIDFSGRLRMPKDTSQAAPPQPETKSEDNKKSGENDWMPSVNKLEEQDASNKQRPPQQKSARQSSSPSSARRTADNNNEQSAELNAITQRVQARMEEESDNQKKNDRIHESLNAQPNSENSPRRRSQSPPRRSQNGRAPRAGRKPVRSQQPQQPKEGRPPDAQTGRSAPQDPDAEGGTENGFHAPNDSDAESRRYKQSKQNQGAVNYDEEAPQATQNASQPSADYATSASGRIRFATKAETIVYEPSFIERQRSLNGGMPKRAYFSRVGCFVILALLVIGAGVAVYFLVFDDDTQAPQIVSNPGGPGGSSTTEMPAFAPISGGSPSMPVSAPNQAPSPVSKPIDEQNKPSPPTSPSSPTQAPFEPTADVLLVLLSAVSLDNGASLLDTTSPQYAAMQWIRTPNNQGIYSDRVFLQRYALATVYYATGGEQWSSSDRWLTNATECEWYSSSDEEICDSEGNLLELNLSNNNLLGTIPPEIALLSNSLEILQLSSNNLGGTIPSALTLLPELENMQLADNRLEGGLPLGVESMPNLLRLVLGRNELRSTIPARLGELRSLEQLDLSSNRFSGEIPFELPRLTNLQFLSLRDNELVGTIPPQFQSLRDLKFLYLDSNALEPPVPNALCNGNLDLTAFWADCDDVNCFCCTRCCDDAGIDCSR